MKINAFSVNIQLFKKIPNFISFILIFLLMFENVHNTNLKINEKPLEVATSLPLVTTKGSFAEGPLDIMFLGS